MGHRQRHGFLYMEAQYSVAAQRRLSFSLFVTLFPPECVEFVGIDIGTKSNMTAARKVELLCTWAKAVDVRAVASFITVDIWHQKWILNFEIQIQPLRMISNS